MRIFALSDLHLSFQVDKPMDIFGPAWLDHAEKIRTAWPGVVAEDDLVLVPGDISWAMRLSEAVEDFAFLGSLPGKKIIIKGNHDYWWASLSKVRQSVPESIVPLQNSSVVFDDIGIAGSRLWLDPDLKLEHTTPEDKKIWERELDRLRLSLQTLPRGLKTRIVMTHFPPISLDGRPSRAVAIAREFGCDIWVFGHMHLGSLDYGGFNRTVEGIRFEFASADYLDFKPKLILDPGL
ncbi:MAG TPA: metallophosphoesterase [Deltaproteobacteria bacterium]|nr:metallophosphoesterase [Deltaproteobacteria bacterium]HOI08808.1 metallophosphoesterase [Deltaproteobacteria bacterium]